MIITKEILKEKEACAEQLNIFIKQWPNGVEVTRENLEKAKEIGLDLVWGIAALLPDSYSDAYEEKRKIIWERYLSQNGFHTPLEVSLWNRYIKELNELIINTLLQYAQDINLAIRRTNNDSTRIY